MDQNNKEEKSFEFEMFFNNLIEKGKIEKEEEVVPGLKIKVRPLDADEQIAAESIAIASNPMMPGDTIEKLRIISILSRCIISINGAPVYTNDDPEKQAKTKRLHMSLMKLPAPVLDKAYAIYLGCVKDQMELYSDKQKLEEDLKNF